LRSRDRRFYGPLDLYGINIDSKFDDRSPKPEAWGDDRRIKKFTFFDKWGLFQKTSGTESTKYR